MASAAHIVRYLRDCYEADNRETVIYNLRHDKVQHLQLLPRAGEFLQGILDVVPVAREAAVAAQKTADLYQTEKSLVFCAFILVGRPGRKSPQIPEKLFAPILFYPAVVRDDQPHAFLEVDLRQQRVNGRALSGCSGKTPRPRIT